MSQSEEERFKNLYGDRGNTCHLSSEILISDNSRLFELLQEARKSPELWLAGLAMKGMLSGEEPGEWNEEYFPKFAENAYKIADAMLAESKKRKGNE